MAKIADLFIAIGADIGDFNKELKKIAKSVDGFGKELKKIGGDLTKSLTLPLAGFATVALRSSKEASAAFATFATQTTRTMGQLGDEIFHALNIQGILDSLADGLQGAVDWFSDLSSGMKTTILSLAAFVAGVGPVVFIVGQVATAVAGLTKAIGALGLAGQFLAKHPLVLLASALAAGAVALGVFQLGSADATTEVRGFVSANEKAVVQLQQSEDALRKFDARQTELTKNLEELKKKLTAAEFGVGIFQAMGVENFREQIKKLEAELAGMNRKQVESQLEADRSAKAYADFGEKMRVAGNAFDLTGDQLAFLKDQQTALKGAIDALLPVLDSQDLGLQELHKSLQLVQQKEGELSEAQRLSAEQIEARNARMLEMQEPLAALIAHIQEIAITTSDFVIGLFDQVSQGIGTAAANIIVFQEDVGEAFKKLGQEILAAVIATLVKIAIQELIFAVSSKLVAAAIGSSFIAVSTVRAAVAAYAAAVESQGLVGLGTGFGFAADAVANVATVAGTAKAAGIGIGTAAAAEGGIFTTPNFTAIAERGRPEIVLNERNVEEFFGGSMGGEGEIHVNVYMDGDRVTEKVLRRIPGKLETYGVRM